MNKSGPEYIKYRQAVITSFAMDAGKLLGKLGAHYDILSSESSLPIEDLLKALQTLKAKVNIDPDHMN